MTRRVLLALLALVLTAAPAGAVGVSRAGGVDRIETALILADRAIALRGQPERVLLASARAFPDGLAAGAAAGADGGVVVLTEPDRLPSSTAAWLASHTGPPVQVVGGPAAVAESVRDAVAEITGARPERVSGADRYATAAALAPDGSSSTVWIASGEGYADALPAGAAAAVADAPLLLTRARSLPAPTRAELVGRSPSSVVVAGGRTAVSDGVLDEIRAAVPTASVTRIAGTDRHDTALRIAATATPGAQGAVMTTGRSWADALAATPLAAALGGPVLLVSQRCVPAPLASALDNYDDVVVAGGPWAVGPRVVGMTPCAEQSVTPSTAQLGVSWRAGCPVEPGSLRRITVDHVTFAGDVAVGTLVVNERVADDVLRVFDELLMARVPLEEVTTADAYGGDDDAIMAANATTAFNCRRVAGTSRWSEHAYGWAIDVNPVQNPYVSGSLVAPDAGRAYLDRSDVRPGMVVAGDVVDRAFADVGWAWGGRWRTAKDYQHFSLTGR